MKIPQLIGAVLGSLEFIICSVFELIIFSESESIWGYVAAILVAMGKTQIFSFEHCGKKDSEPRRGEGDLNSRVQGTVDFESTAIPGYAISADKPPTCKTIISVMSLG